MGNLIASRIVSNPELVGAPNNPDSSWWCRTLARVISVVAAVACAIAGLVVLISSKLRCIFGGILMILLAGMVLVFEAPICCTLIEVTKPLAAFAEKRTFIQKALFYVIAAIIPVIMCAGPGSIVGCGFVFAAGVFYGLMGLGKKADREQMMESAATANNNQMPTSNNMPPNEEPGAGLFENQENYPANRGFN